MKEGSVTISNNTNSYTVTGLSGIDNYNVSIAVNNSHGMMMRDPITVYGKGICDLICKNPEQSRKVKYSV